MDLPARTARGAREIGARARWVGAPVLALAALVAGCGDDGEENDLRREAEEAVESAGARAVAEALRLAIFAQDLEEGEHERDVAVIRRAVDDLPGEPDVAGIEDGDGDGRDDDGNVEVRVNEETACLSVDPGGDVDVTGGAC